MCSIIEQISICSKHHLYLKDGMKLLSASREKLKPVWEQMIEDYSKKTGNKVLTSWGVPTSYVLEYFDIDINYLIKLAEVQKNIVNDGNHPL